MTKLFSAQLY